MTLIFYEKEKPLLNVVFSSCPGFCEDYEHISSWLFDIFHARDHKQFYMNILVFFIILSVTLVTPRTVTLRENYLE